MSLKSIAVWCVAIFLALCPFKEGVKALRTGGLVAAALLLMWAWWKWRRVAGDERERLSAEAVDPTASPLAWRPYIIALLLILGVSFVSALASLAPEFSVKEIRKQLIGFLVIFLVVWNVVRWSGLSSAWRLAWALAWGGAAAALIGIWGYYSGRMIEVGRATGTLDSYTRSAMFYAMQLPLVLALLMEQRRRRAWPGVAVLLAILALGFWYVLLTQTRGVWISVAFVFVLMGLLSRRWLVVGLMLAGAVIAIAASSSLQARLGTFVRHWGEWEHLTSGRIEIWANGWTAIKAHPWLGVGYGSDIFQEESVRAVYNIDNYAKQPDLHQFYLQLLAEVGVLGVAAYLLMAAALIWRTVRGLLPRLRQARREGAPEAASLGLAALGAWGALAGIMIYGLIGNFYENHNAYVFWAMIGLAAGLADLPAVNSRPNTTESPDPS